MRQATLKDFKQGTTLYTSEGYHFTLLRKYADGIWEARGERGDKCIFEGEAHCYKVKN